MFAAAIKMLHFDLKHKSTTNHYRTTLTVEKYDFTVYEGRSFNVVIRVLQGALLIPFTIRLLNHFEVFSLDGITLFKSRNPFCKGREVRLFRYTLKTLINCTTKCTSGFITTTRKGSF